MYDEKNLYLNRGKDTDPKTGIRGSDGRMTYTMPYLETADKMVSDWASAGGGAFKIYLQFRALNEAHGYRTEKLTDAADFDDILKNAKSLFDEDHKNEPDN